MKKAKLVTAEAAVRRNATEQLQQALTALAPRRIPSQQRGRATFELILSTAGDILVTDGGDLFSVDLVAERAGLSVGAIYGFFPNKHSIVNYLAMRTLERFFDLFGDEETPSDPQEVLSQLLRRIQRSSDVWMDPIASTVWYNMNATPEMRLALRRYDDVLARLLAEEIAPLLPHIEAGEQNAIAVVLLAAVIGALDAAMWRPRERRRILEALPRLVTGMLREYGARID